MHHCTLIKSFGPAYFFFLCGEFEAVEVMLPLSMVVVVRLYGNHFVLSHCPARCCPFSGFSWTATGNTVLLVQSVYICFSLLLLVRSTASCIPFAWFLMQITRQTARLQTPHIAASGDYSTSTPAAVAWKRERSSKVDKCTRWVVGTLQVYVYCQYRRGLEVHVR